jgi:hypothetical protein
MLTIPFCDGAMLTIPFCDGAMLTIPFSDGASRSACQLLSAMHADFHLPRTPNGGAPGPAHEILCNLQVRVCR